jgi:hypothetical protein
MIDIKIIFNPGVYGQITQMGEEMKEDVFRRLQKAIVRSIKGGRLCQGELRYQYVQQSIKKSPYLFLAYDDKLVMRGFATVFHINDETLRIDIICTSNKAPRGTGTTLMKKIEEFGKQGNIKTLFLKAIGEAMGFYEDLGYDVNYNAFRNSNNNSNSNSNSNESNNMSQINIYKFAGDIPMIKKIGGTRRLRRSKRKSATRKKSR